MNCIIAIFSILNISQYFLYDLRNQFENQFIFLPEQTFFSISIKNNLMPNNLLDSNANWTPFLCSRDNVRNIYNNLNCMDLNFKNKNYMFFSNVVIYSGYYNENLDTIINLYYVNSNQFSKQKRFDFTKLEDISDVIFNKDKLTIYGKDIY